jgi:hypothetical protein
VFEVPTGSSPSAERVSAVEVTESIVTRPPNRRTPLTVDVACDTDAEPSRNDRVVDWIEPMVTSAVSAGSVPGGGGIAPGSGSPVGPPPGTAPRRIAPMLESVDESYWSRCAEAPPPWPDSGLDGLPKVTAPAVLVSVAVRLSDSATKGHAVCVQAATTGANSPANGSGNCENAWPPISLQASAGPRTTPAPGSRMPARAKGPRVASMRDPPSPNTTWVAPAIGVSPRLRSG